VCHQFKFSAAHIATMVSALPALRVLDVDVGSLSSLECFISSYTRTQLRTLRVDRGYVIPDGCPPLPMSALEPLRALTALHHLMWFMPFKVLISDDEWVRWRVDGPGPHFAHPAQPHLSFVAINLRRSGVHTKVADLPPAFIASA
jgi:hypothetical protein